MFNIAINIWRDGQCDADDPFLGFDMWKGHESFLFSSRTLRFIFNRWGFHRVVDITFISNDLLYVLQTSNHPDDIKDDIRALVWVRKPVIRLYKERLKERK